MPGNDRATADLIDRIYEAAFVPDLWPAVLDAINRASGSASGALQILKDGREPLWTATELIRGALGGFIAGGLWRTCERPAALAVQDHAGFVCADDYLSREQLARDPVVPILRELGLGWQAATLIAMPSGEMVGLTFERRLRDGRHDACGLALLDALRPHLARAALIAARLGLERARTAVATLSALDLPAAVLTESGRVLAANALVDAGCGLAPAAHGRLMLTEPAADRLLREALAAIERTCVAQSIPVPAADERPPAIAHLIPLRGSAHDIFGGTVLVVLTAIRMEAGVPDLKLLRGLFDLTPGEAKLAAALAAGRSLKDAADALHLQISTARAYLEQVFRKTGTNRQSQLVALLKGAPLALA